ncbi:MAG: hypothetical protein CTY31_00175 [Hyphomicrobium sp.]|nr:MAG: hypothetical protein CTY39_00020 [Hyphomicrobium sp.]PPD01254.1 MAG: hypothetical protein CTY31_00175 [Hyphomicrobium sp.]
MSDRADIIELRDLSDWIVIGFFTPNYRPMAEAFAKSLSSQNHPHHLFAVENSGTWSNVTMLKPTVILNAMDHYPNKSLILMDVDCIVNGSLHELAQFQPNADVSCYTTLTMKQLRRHRQNFSLSSRVMLIRPTHGARDFMIKWREACDERPWMYGAERNLVLAFSRAIGVSFSPLSITYSGREVGTKKATNAIITHKSAVKTFQENTSMTARALNRASRLFVFK